MASGERLLASVRAMPMGLYGGSMGIYAGSVMGAVIQSVAVSRAVRSAALSRFPLAGRMVIGLTDRRLLVWRTGGLIGASITRLVGQVPVSRLSRIDLGSVAGRSTLTFVPRDARPVTVEADIRDHPRRFAEAFRPLAPAQPPSEPSAVPPG